MRYRAKNTTPPYALYLNGLERTHTGTFEKLLAKYFRLWGVFFKHLSVDWHTGKPFQVLLDDATNEAEKILHQHRKLVLIGASAGGSLAVSVFARLRSKYPGADIYVIVLSGRLHVGDSDNLIHTALHRPGKKPSLAFIDSVHYCERKVLSRLTQADKRRMVTFRPLLFDEAVPLSTMGIHGVTMLIAPIFYHVPGIVVAALRVPRTIRNRCP